MSSRIRILFNVWADIDNTNAQSLNARDIALRLDPERFESTLFVARRPDPRLLNRETIHLIRLPPRLRSLVVARHLIWGDYDILFYPPHNHLMTWYRALVWTGKRKKIIATVEGTAQQIQAVPSPSRERLLHVLHEADACYACSPHVAATVQQAFGIKMDVVPLGVDTAAFTPVDRADHWPPIKVLCVGSIQPRKQIHLILDLAQHIGFPDLTGVELSASSDDDSVRVSVEGTTLLIDPGQDYYNTDTGGNDLTVLALHGEKVIGELSLHSTIQQQRDIVFTLEDIFGDYNYQGIYVVKNGDTLGVTDESGAAYVQVGNDTATVTFTKDGVLKTTIVPLREGARDTSIKVITGSSELQTEAIGAIINGWHGGQLGSPEFYSFNSNLADSFTVDGVIQIPISVGIDTTDQEAVRYFYALVDSMNKWADEGKICRAGQRHYNIAHLIHNDATTVQQDVALLESMKQKYDGLIVLVGNVWDDPGNYANGGKADNFIVTKGVAHFPKHLFGTGIEFEEMLTAMRQTGELPEEYAKAIGFFGSPFSHGKYKRPTVMVMYNGREVYVIAMVTAAQDNLPRGAILRAGSITYPRF